MFTDDSFEELASGRLKDAFGDQILNLLYDPLTLEVMVNPDGSVFCEREGGSVRRESQVRPSLAREVILTLSAMRGSGERDEKLFSCELPFCKARFEGIMPPLCEEPCFCIRRHGSLKLTLEDLRENRIISEECALYLKDAIARRRSIIVCGRTGCGKTTFMNALLNEAASLNPDDRAICIEDTPELTLHFKNSVKLKACDGTDPGALVRATLRMRPDRIIIGEVRGCEALDLIDALSSGHSGAMTTMHAGSAQEALGRLMLLASRHPRCPRAIEPLIAGALDLVVVLKSRPRRQLAELCEIKGFKDSSFVLEKTGVQLC